MITCPQMLLTVSDKGGSVEGSRGHIGGDRAAAFRELVKEVDPARVLVVGIDVAKASWFVLGCALDGEVVLNGTKIAATAEGMACLEQLLDRARRERAAELVVVGIEAAGHYHQTLTAHLDGRRDLIVRVVNPAAVAAIRKSQLNRRRKTDWLDAAAICELLMRGEGTASLLADTPAAALRPLWNGRKDLLDARVALRLQALALVDCLWPGLTARDATLGIRPPRRGLFKTKAGRIVLDLLARGWSPQQLADLGVSGMKQLFAQYDCQLKVTIADRLIACARDCLPPHPAAIAGKPQLLAALLTALEGVDAAVEQVEAEMATRLPHTEGAKLTQIDGVGVVVASGFVAFVGSAHRWPHWSKVWRGAGLDPARSQSGPVDAHMSISREGSAWGRRAILDLAAAAIGKPGRWRTAYQRRITDGHKPPLVALAATANSVGRTCFTLMLTGADYDPDHEHNRREQRSAAAADGGRQAA
jgi:transposase